MQLHPNQNISQWNSPINNISMGKFSEFLGSIYKQRRSKWEPWSQSENRCFNGKNNKKTVSISVEHLTILVLIPHQNENTFPILRNLCGTLVLVPHQNENTFPDLRNLCGGPDLWLPLTEVSWPAEEAAAMVALGCSCHTVVTCYMLGLWWNIYIFPLDLGVSIWERCSDLVSMGSRTPFPSKT